MNTSKEWRDRRDELKAKINDLKNGKVQQPSPKKKPNVLVRIWRFIISLFWSFNFDKDKPLVTSPEKQLEILNHKLFVHRRNKSMSSAYRFYPFPKTGRKGYFLRREDMERLGLVNTSRKKLVV